jgi:hypothetical protein
VEFFSPCLGWLKGETFHLSLLLSHFLKSIGENIVTMILWFLNLRHSGTLFGVVGYYGDATGSPFLPLLAALSSFSDALDSGLGRYDLATVSDRFRVT